MSVESIRAYVETAKGHIQSADLSPVSEEDPLSVEPIEEHVRALIAALHGLDERIGAEVERTRTHHDAIMQGRIMLADLSQDSYNPHSQRADKAAMLSADALLYRGRTLEEMRKTVGELGAGVLDLFKEKASDIITEHAMAVTYQDGARGMQQASIEAANAYIANLTGSAAST